MSSFSILGEQSQLLWCQLPTIERVLVVHARGLGRTWQPVGDELGGRRRKVGDELVRRRRWRGAWRPWREGKLAGRQCQRGRLVERRRWRGERCPLHPAATHFGLVGFGLQVFFLHSVGLRPRRRRHLVRCRRARRLGPGLPGLGRALVPRRRRSVRGCSRGHRQLRLPPFRLPPRLVRPGVPPVRCPFLHGSHPRALVVDMHVVLRSGGAAAAPPRGDWLLVGSGEATHALHLVAGAHVGVYLGAQKRQRVCHSLCLRHRPTMFKSAASNTPARL